MSATELSFPGNHWECWWAILWAIKYDERVHAMARWSGRSSPKRMRIVNGQMMSMLSPRVPAKIASVPSAVGNGHERTAKDGVTFGTWKRNAIWLTIVDSQILARRVVLG